LEFAKTAALSQDDWMLALALQCTAVSVALDLKKTPEILQSVEQFLTDPIDAELQIVITKLRSGIFEYRKEIENTMMAGNIDSALDRSHALVVALLEAAKENDSLRNELFTACSYVENLANKSYEKYFNLHKASSSRVQRGQAVEEMDKAVRYLADAVRIARRQSNLDYDLTYMADTVRNLRAARR